MPKKPVVERTNNELREIILNYFYERNARATSARGKRGSAVKISDVKAELKASQHLSQQQVHGNLTYLISQGWIEEIQEAKQIQAPGGTMIPSVTKYYQITAAGIDKVEGPGEFTMKKFGDINIQATGQNVITLGDGNVVDAKFGDLGASLLELREAMIASNVSESVKMSYAADIDTIQAQLAKPEPNRGILVAAWDSIKAAASIDGCANLVVKVAGFLGPFLG